MEPDAAAIDLMSQRKTAGRRRTHAKGHGRAVARSKIAGDGGSWRLAGRGPIRVFDEYTDRMIEIEPGQSDPGSIKGLLIDFRYAASDGEVTRRLLLCWQCGREANRIYVRGYCPFREELRTFRIDRMSDVIALQGARDIPISDINAFFAAFAAAPTAENDRQVLEPPRR
jgi:hypothetical protein